MLENILLLLFIRPGRYLLERIQTSDTKAPGWKKVLLAVVATPVIGMVFVVPFVYLKLFGPVEVMGQARSGKKFRCQLPDLVQLYIYFFGVWEPDQTAYCQRVLQDEDGFIDVGANIGYYSILAKQVIGKNGTVVAIEASPSIANHFRDSCKLNGQKNSVRLIQEAVSDRAGTILLHEGPSHNRGQTSTIKTNVGVQETEVSTNRLDDLLSLEEISRARLVKIDVEGGEPGVIKGMPKFLEQCRDDVEFLIEVSPHWWNDKELTPQIVLAPLFKAGFHAYRMKNSYLPWRYLWPEDVSSPKRVTDSLAHVKRGMDLVLSRRDLEIL